MVVCLWKLKVKEAAVRQRDFSEESETANSSASNLEIIASSSFTIKLDSKTKQKCAGRQLIFVFSSNFEFVQNSCSSQRVGSSLLDPCAYEKARDFGEEQTIKSASQ